MKTSKRIIILSSDNEESIVCNSWQPGEVLAEQYVVQYLLDKDSFITSYVCRGRDSNIFETFVIYHISEDIACNHEVLAKLRLYLDNLRLLKSQNIFTSYQLLSFSPKETFIIAKYPVGQTILQWCSTHDISSSDNRYILKRFLLEAASGLDYLHSCGMFHGNVIPENMFITNENTLLLLNTGIISFLKQQSIRRYKIYNENEHLNYLPPELLNKQAITPKTEQYALAATAYELLSGQKIYGWVRADLLKRVVSTQEPDSPENSTKRERSALMRALHHNPQMRYSSCRGFVKALTPIKLSPLQEKMVVAILLFLFLLTGGIGISRHVSQKLEQERVAQLNQKAKIERERQEAEIKRRSNEAGQLQWKANAVLTDVLSRDLYEGQTFGKRIETAKMKYAEGVKALEAGQRFEAYALFTESLDNSEWIRNNAETRMSLGQMVQQVLALKDKNKDKSEELYPDKWKSAVDKCNAAVVSYEAGDFKQAEIKLKETELDFMNMANDVRKFMKKQYVELAEKSLKDKNWKLLQEYANKIEDFDKELGKEYHERANTGLKLQQIAVELSAAKSQKERQDWQAVIVHCDKILEFEATNIEAKEMRKEAILATTCNLFAITKIEDKIVASSIEINGIPVSGNTKDVIKGLPLNEKNKIRFICKNDKVQYEWEGTIDCNWRGVRKFDFQLEESVILLARQAEEALKKEKWVELQTLAQKMLLLEPQSELALKYKEKAVLGQSCNVDIVPLIDGKVVKAEYFLDSQKYYTGSLLRNLKKEQDYVLELHSELEGIQYEGIGKFHADWNGVRNINVPMQKTTDVLVKKAQDALQEEKWVELQTLAQKMLLLEPQSELALKYKEKAVLGQSCNVDIVPLIDGKVVKAEYFLDSHKYYTGALLRNLKKEQDYVLELHSEVEGIQYEGICKFHADWNGVRNINVPMQKTTDVFLKKAQEAFQVQNWSVARENARKVLDILPMDTTANRILGEVELALTSNLKIKAMLNGREVDALVSDFNDSWSFCKIIRNLEKGEKYHYDLKYTSGGKLYKGQYEITCDWQGMKEVEVILLDEFERLAEAAIVLKNGEKWDELLRIAKEMQKLEGENQLAKSYIDLAEINTSKCMQIQVYLASKQVICNVFKCETSGDSIVARKMGETSSLIRNISVQQPQTFCVIYTEGNDCYWGKLDVNEDWKGIKVKNIILRKWNPERIPLKNEVLRFAKVESEFWIGKYEITQGQYKLISESYNPSYNSQIDTNVSFAGKKIYKSADTYPVERISWNDAQEFCKLLTDKCVRDGVMPPVYKFSLPTIAQWKQALWKEVKLQNMAKCTLRSICWYYENSRQCSHAVGTKSTSGKLYDMLGNVSEWCMESRDYTAASIGGHFESYPLGNITDCLSKELEDGVVWIHKSGNPRTGFRIVLIPIEVLE